MSAKPIAPRQAGAIHCGIAANRGSSMTMHWRMGRIVRPLHSAVRPHTASGSGAQAACSSMWTVRPIAVAMLTSASIEKRDTRPRSKSFMRGCVTPQRCAASS